MRYTVLAAAITVALLSASTPAFAGTGNPNGTGQPSQSCQAQSSSPGNASSAPGSAFNSSGTAGTHYAGQQPQNSTNPKSVSQYDVACYQVSK
jgi:hypothetical protein